MGKVIQFPGCAYSHLDNDDTMTAVDRLRRLLELSEFVWSEIEAATDVLVSSWKRILKKESAL